MYIRCYLINVFFLYSFHEFFIIFKCISLNFINHSFIQNGFLIAMVGRILIILLLMYIRCYLINVFFLYSFHEFFIIFKCISLNFINHSFIQNGFLIAMVGRILIIIIFSVKVVNIFICIFNSKEIELMTKS